MEEDSDLAAVDPINEGSPLLQEDVIVLNRLQVQKGSSWYASVFLVINAVLGAGLLNFPAAYGKCGGIFVAIVIQGVLLIFIIGALIILAYCSDIQKSATYQDVVKCMCGRRVQQACAVTLILYTFGTCVTFFIIVGDQLDKFFTHAYGPDYCFKWYLERKFTMITSCVLLVLPLCFSKRIDFLKYVSFFGVLAVMYTVFLVTIKYFLGPNNPGPVKTRPSAVTDVFTVIPVICFGYQCHVSVVPIYSCMENRNLKEFSRTVIIAIFVTVVTYSVTASFGYLTFGSKINDDILLSYEPTTDVLVAVILIAAKMYTTYPILLFVGRTVVDGIWTDVTKMPPLEAANGEQRRRFIIASVWFSSSLILSVFLPNIGVVISVLGCLAAAFIFIYPGLCLLQVLMKNYLDVELYRHRFQVLLLMSGGYLMIGTFILGQSVVQTLWNDIEQRSTSISTNSSVCP